MTEAIIDGARGDSTLASMRRANGTIGYVELSPAGRCRRAGSEGEVVQVSTADVVERHRHAQGIKCMSLERLMRLREEEGKRRPGRSTSRKW